MYLVELFSFVPEKTVWIGVSSNNKSEVVKLAKQYGVDFDMRDVGEVIADFWARGIQTFPQIILPMLTKQPDGSMKSLISIRGAELIPLGGIADQITVMCNQSGRFVTYRTDEHGFRNPKGMWSSDRVEIAAVGNSFAQGYCVPFDKDFVALIRKRHPATLNLSMTGDGPLLMLATLEEYLPRFRPKTVLWFYAESNHLFDLQTEKKSRLLMRYLEFNFKQGLLSRQKETDQALVDYVHKKSAQKTTEKPRHQNRFADLLQTVKLGALRQKFGLVHGHDTQEAAVVADLRGPITNLFGDILSQAKNRVRTWGGRLYFIYLPAWERYANHNLGLASKERAKILTLVSTLGIPIIDINGAFQAQSDPLSLFPFRRFGHYNEQGHRVVAKEVLKVIGSGELDDQRSATN